MGRKKISDPFDGRTKIHRWSILSYSHHVGNNHFWLCRCECGTERSVRERVLRDGSSKSCGCIRSEQFKTHGRSGTPEYTAWTEMNRRCSNKNCNVYKHYGGRGVKVCDRWKNSFENFLEDMGEKPSENHSIDRFPDKNGDYEPGNCRWATRREQATNRRNNHIIEYEGKSLTLTEWAELYGIYPKSLRARLRYGWDFQKAISEPINPKMLKNTKIPNMRKHVLCLEGISNTINDWSKITGIDKKVIISRVLSGWDTKKTLETPVRDWGPGKKRK
jgi:hypothetical protein